MLRLTRPEMKWLAKRRLMKRKWRFFVALLDPSMLWLVTIFSSIKTALVSRTNVNRKAKRMRTYITMAKTT